MVGGGGVRLAEESVVRSGEFFIAIDARHDARSPRAQAMVRIASRIEEAWLEELFPQALQRQRVAEYDPGRQRVVGRLKIWYRDLLLREETTGEVDAPQAERALFEALLPRAQALLDEDEQLGAVMKRVAFLAAAMPGAAGGANQPALPDPAALLADACAGAVSLQQVRDHLRHALDARLGYAHRRLLDEHAPEAIEVPTGNRIRLDWSAASAGPELRGPVLAVRLQELFGLPETPRVAGGRVPVVLHLLGPNYRPVQVTSDLASFWKNTYPQVRKDLRARYPKHAWPEDPLAAVPQAKGGRARRP
jgi:ATP-dependent helicase HrpB